MSEAEIRFYVLLSAMGATFFGACVGSFLNVCIYRIPRDESVITPRSHCPHCNVLIRWYQNIPVFSWLGLRGRCATCKGPIAFRYTLVELLTALLFLTVFIKWATPAAFYMYPLADPMIIPVYWLVLSGLVLGTFIDFEHFIIPDSVTIGGMVAGPLVSVLLPALHHQILWWQGLLSSCTGLIIGFGLLQAIAWLGAKAFKKEAMGFGDVKLLGAIGAFLGWEAVFATIFISSVLGSISGIALIIFGRVKLQSRIPFGPYLATAATLWMFWGQTLLEVYFKLIGHVTFITP